LCREDQLQREISNEKYSLSNAAFGRACIIGVQNGRITHSRKRKKTANEVLETDSVRTDHESGSIPGYLPLKFFGKPGFVSRVNELWEI